MYSNRAPKREYKRNNSLLEKYIEGMSNGDKNSLIEFYEITKNDVYTFILSTIGNREDALDIFQEVYIKVYENANMYQAYGKPFAWVLTITKNLCYMKLRGNREFVDIDDLYDLSSDEKISDKVENKLLINAIFKNISGEERQIIVLHVVVGLKHREIAKMLDLSLSTVLSKYNRAIKKLKKMLEEDMI